MGCDYYEHESTIITFNNGFEEISYSSGFERGYYPYDNDDFDEEKFLEYTDKKIVYDNGWLVKNNNKYRSVYSRIGNLFYDQIKSIKKSYYIEDDRECIDIIVTFTDLSEKTFEFKRQLLYGDILKVIDYTKKVEKVFENIEDFKKSEYSSIISELDKFLGQKNFNVVKEIYIETSRTER